MKKLIAAVTTAGLVIAGTAGIAGAAETPRARTEAHSGNGTGRRVVAAVRVAATTIGIEPQELWTALRDGDSVADVAGAHDVDPQAVIDAIVAAASTKIDAAVAAGKIDADRGATLKERSPARAAKIVNGNLEARADRAKIRRHARRAGFGIAAATIGIDAKALRDAVRGGQSIADVAREHDVDPQAVVDAVVAAANTKIDAAVAAEKIDPARAERIKDRLADRVTTRVNATPRDRVAGS